MRWNPRGGAFHLTPPSLPVATFLRLAAIPHVPSGIFFGVIARPTLLALDSGFVWLLMVENIIKQIWPATVRWLPGSVFSSLTPNANASGLPQGNDILIAAFVRSAACHCVLSHFRAKRHHSVSQGSEIVNDANDR